MMYFSIISCVPLACQSGSAGTPHRGRKDDANEQRNCITGTARFSTCIVEPSKDERPGRQMLQLGIDYKTKSATSAIWVGKDPLDPVFVGCFPYKNGVSWWAKFACAMSLGCTDGSWHFLESHALQERQIVPDIMARVPSIMVTRNPMIRVLSAYLTWLGSGSDVNVVPPQFDEFVQDLELSRDSGSTYWRNAHWIPQVEYCGLKQGSSFTEHRAENRGHWGPRFFDMLGPNIMELALSLNFTFLADQPNANRSGRGYNMHAKDVMGLYYTPALYDRVRAYYIEDLHRFGYEADAATLRNELFPERVSLSEIPPGISQLSPYEQGRILDSYEDILHD